MPEFVPREHASVRASVLAPFLALALTVVVSLVLFALLGKPSGAALHALFIEPFLSWYSFSEVLLKTGPLLLIAQGLAIGFRAKVFNIGAEGQLILGAICASALPVYLPTSTSPWLWPAMMVLGALGGALWASIAALWRTWLNASEILVTLMLSLVASQLLNYLLLGPWKDPAGFNFPQSVMFQYEAMLPTLLPGTRVNVSLLFGLAATLAAWVLMQLSFLGYQLVVGGLAPRAASYAGFRGGRAVWVSLLLGGLAAGLAGAAEVAGPIGQLQRSVASGYGFTAITVAYLGGLRPLGIVLSSFLMAVITIGGDSAMVTADLPVAAVRVVQGLLLIFYLAALVGVRYRIVWSRIATQATS
ncbi:ABC transporter permease [Rubellimicrobium rubrum]|uniref:ABC transporter permease n=1 Tax=Rubellimicrobium rubrum TaxID=2585369 RepID=A0A5C4N3Q0_9RHOB|nr:ABC transporter permease [Rubellimicrobium rubrum]TNC51615.1 ABC transporter permease [Rubellimicrobium rubrum]